MFQKVTKKIILLTAAILIMANSAFAQGYAVPQELDSYGDRIYAQVRSRFGRSFSGYCGTYVGYQLRAMGILGEDPEFRGNGNQWYSNFDNVKQTSQGYYVYRERGSDCIEKLVEKYGNDLSNIVLSFPVQAGYSAAYPGAGHAFILYKLVDGVAYYSESFGFGSYREGEVIAEDVYDLIARYSRRHGSPIGCVLLSDTDLEKELAGIQDEEIMQDILQSIEQMSDVTLLAAGFTEISHA